MQLLDLPSAAQDSHTWTSPSERGEGEATTFLSLNLSHLAESLSALPTHARLALPADLLQRYGMSEGDVLLPTQDKAHVDETSPSATLTPSADLTPSSTEHASLTSSIDLRPLLSKNRSQTESTFDFSAPSKLRPPPGLATPTTGSEATETPNSTSHHPLASREHSVAAEDQGLDALLHGTSHATSHMHLPTPRGPPAMVDSGRVGDWKPTAVKREGLVTASMAKGTVPTTADLDSVLDDLLA